jgi:hypothetical protein
MSARSFFLWVLALTFLVSSGRVCASSLTDLLKWPPGQVPAGQINRPDGLDDIWQGIHNAWGIAPGEDEDKDGFSNELESVAGTNPFRATDSFKIGQMTIVGNAVLFTTKVEAGKKYRVLSSSSPNGPTWSPTALQTPVMGLEYVPAADLESAVISVQTPGDTKMFYKLETSDVNSSGDGISDWVKRKHSRLEPTHLPAGTDLDHASGALLRQRGQRADAHRGGGQWEHAGHPHLERSAQGGTVSGAGPCLEGRAHRPAR